MTRARVTDGFCWIDGCKTSRAEHAGSARDEVPRKRLRVSGAHAVRFIYARNPQGYLRRLLFKSAFRRNAQADL